MMEVAREHCGFVFNQNVEVDQSVKLYFCRIPLLLMHVVVSIAKVLLVARSWTSTSEAKIWAEQ